VQLVAGGKALHDKCAVQILNEKANPIGGDVVILSDLRASPTTSETTYNSDNGPMKKKLLETYSLMIQSILRTKKKVGFEKEKFAAEIALKA
jgi:hypothetical protein